MRIEKINSYEEIDVTIKDVRLPSLTKPNGRLDECEYIISTSYLFGNGNLNFAIFKDFEDDEDEFQNDMEHSPIYGNEYDTNGLIDLIPVIEIEEDFLEVDTLYLVNNIPFIAANKNKLICLGRTSFYTMSDIESLDYGRVCLFVNVNLRAIWDWE